MSLLIHLITRLIAVVALCLAGASAWIMLDTHRSIEAATAASADRTARHLEGLYWQQLLWRGGMRRHMLLPSPEWETLATLNVLSPGVCVTFAPPDSDPRRLCSQVEAIGPSAPYWFASLDRALFKPLEPVSRVVAVHDQDAGTIHVVADPEATLRQAWIQVSIVVGVAAAMALGIAALAALLIGHALLPARAIIDGLRKLEQGDLRWRLPRFGTAELDHIARAANDLAAKLSETNAARAELTVRLLEVQEEERRALARDLHDEFGQSLTATIALASLIEAQAGAERQDIAADARKISDVQKGLMETLRGTLERLRSQHIEEVGLEASLRQLVADYNSQSAARTVYRLNFAGQMPTLPKRIAVDIYRIAQECLTNAARHGRPTEVWLNVARSSADPGWVGVLVEDDGGGDAAHVNRRPGHGILGMRERLAALGGNLSIGAAVRGIRVAARIPVPLDLGPAGLSAMA